MLDLALDLALDYAHRGLHVFACSPANKQPLTKNGVKDATTDETLIRTMWRHHPTAMIGVACGEKSNVWCLDPDAPTDKNPIDGRESWKKLQAEQGPVPATHTHITPGGGNHLIFKWRPDRAPVTNREGWLKGTHINVRGQGGYFIAAGSINSDGVKYQMAEPLDHFSFAPAPDWLHDMIEAKPDRELQGLTISQQAAALVRVPEKAMNGDRFTDYADSGSTGNGYAESGLRGETDKLALTLIDRNIALNNAAMSLGRFVKSAELTEADVIDALMKASDTNGLNRDDGRAASLATIKSGMGAATARKLPLRGESDVSQEQGTGSQESKPETKPPFEVFWHGIDYDRAARPWLVRTLLPEQGAGLISGQWGTGKTFVGIDLAGCVMTGSPFAGREIARKGGVLFIAAEGASEVSIRLEAMATKHNTGGALPFAWIEDTPDLKNDVSYKRLLDACIAVGVAMKEKSGVDLTLIEVDTMSAAAQWKDHNDAAEGQLVMNRLNEISRKTGAFVLAVDHFGKDATTGTRGTSAKEAAADVVLATLAERDLSGILSKTRMAVRKLRGGKTGEEFPFDLQVVPAGFNETTCVIEWREPSAASDSGATSEKVRWPKSLRVFRTSMQAMVSDKGRSISPYGAEGPTVTAVVQADLRTEFMASYPVDEGGERDQKASKRAAFNRALKDARAAELVASREIGGVDLIWFAKE